MSAPVPVIEAKDVAVVLGGFTIFANLDLTVQQGEIVSILGDIGTGKSTLLRVLAGEVEIAAGSLSVLGHTVADDEAYRRDVVLAAGEPYWVKGETVAAYVERMRAAREPIDEEWPSPAEMLDAFEILGRGPTEPLTLSQGLRQRLSLAGALSRPSRLLLIDDPEFGLDTAFRPKLASILAGYARRGGTVVLGTHDLELSTATGAREFSLDGLSTSGSW